MKTACRFLFLCLLLVAVCSVSSYAGEEEDEYEGYTFRIDPWKNKNYSASIMETTSQQYNDVESYRRERVLEIDVEIIEIKKDYPEQIQLSYNADKTTTHSNGQVVSDTESNLIDSVIIMDRGEDDVRDSPTGGSLGGALNRQWKLANWDEFWLPAKGMNPKQSWKIDDEKVGPLLQNGENTNTDLSDVSSKATFVSLKQNMATIQIEGKCTSESQNANYSLEIEFELVIKFDTVKQRVVSWDYQKEVTTLSGNNNQAVTRSIRMDHATGRFTYTRK